MNIDSPVRDSQVANVRPHVLIVDDDELIRGLCSEIVQSCGMAVKTAGTTEAAIDFLSREQFDLVVTDIRVPALQAQQK